VTRGFSMIVGNPPWVSYAGKAAQPIGDARRRFYTEFYPSFAGFRNLQGMFVERIAGVLRPKGRLGLVLPSSMAELHGYRYSRAAHDCYAVCDADLTSLPEDAFQGVAQPSMVLQSTAREHVLAEGSEASWPIERPDVDDEARAILARLERTPLPPDTFGEMGFQTNGDDSSKFLDAPSETHTVALRGGSDIKAFCRGTPSFYADPTYFGRRLRAPETWRKADVFVRQTARVPIAVRSDGMAFRNTILACFGSEEFPADFLVAYLNTTLIRWRHYYSNRDARLGMPQVKIGHLRKIPAPSQGVVRALAVIGAAVSARNTGITEDEQHAINELVMDAFDLSDTERARVRSDSAKWS
jgi:hypothetical protein